MPNARRSFLQPLQWLLFFALPALLAAALFALLAPVPTASAATLTVCASDGGYTTIQTAVNAAGGGDVIEICAGVYDESVDLSGMASPGALTLRGVGAVWISPTTGAALYAPTSFDGSLTLETLGLTAPQGNGLSIPQLKGDLTVFDVDIVDVGENGISGLVEGSLTISNSSVLSSTTHGVLLVVAQQAHVYTSTFSGNGHGGLGSGLDIQPGQLVTCGADTAELDNVTAEENSGDGVAVRADNGAIAIRNTSALRNQDNGLDLVASDYCGARLTLEGVTANDNGSIQPPYASGIVLHAQWVDITDTVASGNTAHGIEQFDLLCAQASGCQLSAAEPAPAAAAGVLGGATSDPYLRVSNTTVYGNAGDGLHLGDKRYITVTNVSAINNAMTGIYLPVAVAEPQVSAAEASLFGSPTTADVADSLIVRNDIGIQIEDSTFPSGVQGEVQAADADVPVNIHNSMVCRNESAGVSASGIVSNSYDSRYNYWGALDGPYHDSRNPSGSGNDVVDSDSGEGDGYISFAPWLDSVAAYVLPIPAAIPGGENRFSFNLYGNSEHLGVGPGNLEDVPPFTVTTSSGVIETLYGRGASAPGRIDSTGWLTGLVVPAAAGAFTVTVTGPCGELGEFAFDAADVQLVVSKTPAKQSVLPNGTVTFTVDFTNTGTTQLVNVIVTDTLVPGCNMDLETLDPGERHGIVCTRENVTADFTNVVTVTANPYVNDNPNAAGVPPEAVVVSGTAVAAVDVVSPSLALVKSVGTDANLCATAGPLTVPANTPVYYCIRLVNTGDVTLTHHSVSDPLLGVFNVPITYTLAPAASLPLTRSVIPALGPIAVTAPITNIVAVTSTGVITEVGGVSVPAVDVAVQGINGVVVRPQPTGLEPGAEPALNSLLFLPSLQK